MATSTLPPAPGGVTREQRAEDAAGRVQAGHRIGGRRTDDARRLRRDEHAEESRQRLADRVVGRTIAYGPSRPNPRIEQYTRRGLRCATSAAPKPRRSITPGRKFWT